VNRRLIKWCGLLCFSFSFQSLAMNDSELINKCLSDLKFYDENYITESGKKKFSFEQRLDYLSKLKKPCFDLDSAIIIRANTLFEMNKHKEAIAEMDRGLKLNPNRQGNLLLSKATFLYLLKSSGFEVTESYRELTELLQLALKSGCENPHLAHLTWAEIAIEIGDETGDYDEAVEHVIAGNNIKTIYRFYTLFTIIGERLGEYEKAVSFISDAVKNEGTTEYLHEADTVLSLTKSLCALGEREQAILVVESAIKISDIQRNNPMIKQAAKFVLENCSNQHNPS